MPVFTESEFVSSSPFPIFLQKNNHDQINNLLHPSQSQDWNAVRKITVTWHGQQQSYSIFQVTKLADMANSLSNKIKLEKK